MVKYAECSTLEISMHYRNEWLFILIQDNGKGFDNTVITNGNGLKNLYSRVKELHGHSNVHSEPGKGVSVEFSFPIAIISHNH